MTLLELKFDRTKCAECRAISCLVKCQYMDFENRVTYQDPCFLGRYNNIYDEPRQILQSIPGIELVEMERNRKDAFCCGGGSGNFVTDLLAGSPDSPARIRIREA
jgi:Fe-S oxidoreductase